MRMVITGCDSSVCNDCIDCSIFKSPLCKAPSIYFSQLTIKRNSSHLDILVMFPFTIGIIFGKISFKLNTCLKHWEQWHKQHEVNTSLAVCTNGGQCWSQGQIFYPTLMCALIQVHQITRQKTDLELQQKYNTTAIKNYKYPTKMKRQRGQSS